MARDYTKIRAWVLADELALKVYEITRGFPASERYGLTSQLRRAASSVPANIAEGSNRTSRKEYLQFLSIASGSIAEVRYFLLLAKRLGLMDAAQHASSDLLVDVTGKTLTGLISDIKQEQSNH